MVERKQRSTRRLREILRISHPNGKNTLPPISSFSQEDGILFPAKQVPDSSPEPRNPEERVELTKLKHVLENQIGGFAVTAGAGHLRPLIAAYRALHESFPIICTKTTADAAHNFGSNNAFGKAFTEFFQRNIEPQNVIFAPIAHQLSLVRDVTVVLSSADHLFTEARKNNRHGVIAFCTNPEPAYILAYFKKQLEEHYDMPLHIVLYMTDHFPSRPHLIWNLIDADLIIAPDCQTKEVTERELNRWRRTMRSVRKDRPEHIPEVRVCGFIQDMRLGQKLSQELRQNRERQLSRDISASLDIALLFGGSSPGMPYTTSMSKRLSYLYPKVSFTTIYRENATPATEEFASLMKFLNADQRVVKTHAELISQLAAIFIEKTPPSVIVVKPSELSNFLIFPEGPVFLFTPPVGDQERQNLEFYRSAEGRYVLPTQKENDELTNILLSAYYKNLPDAEMQARLSPFLAHARGWRGLVLPNRSKNQRSSGIEAAIFLFMAKKYGILEAMTHFSKPSLQTKAMSDRGAIEVWYEIEEWLKEKSASAN